MKDTSNRTFFGDLKFSDLLFVTLLARVGSMTSAAEKIGMSKGQGSKILANLEKRLDVRLFERTTRRCSITDRGLELVTGFEDMLRIWEGTMATLSGMGPAAPALWVQDIPSSRSVMRAKLYQSLYRAGGGQVAHTQATLVAFLRQVLLHEAVSPKDILSLLRGAVQPHHCDKVLQWDLDQFLSDDGINEHVWTCDMRQRLTHNLLAALNTKG